jgi:hypothetical protein
VNTLVDQIDSLSQFHQHFKSKFYAYFLAQKNYKAKPQLLCEKSVHKMLVKLTPDRFAS